MIAEIEDYLRNPANYSAGVELLKKHSPNSPLLPLLSSGASTFTRGKLSAALQQISALEPEPERETKLPPLKDFRAKSESRFVQIDFNNLPPKLKEKFREKQALYKQSVELHRGLTMAMSDDDRKEMALQILSNFDTIDKIWAEAEKYQEHGYYEDEATGQEMTALDLARLLDNLKKNQYKYKNKPTYSNRYQELGLKIKEVEDALRKR